MSPNIFPVPAIAPSTRLGRGAGGGGTTWAKGTPNFVTRTGRRVRWTRLSTERQVALNLEAAIFSILNLYHGQRP